MNSVSGKDVGITNGFNGINDSFFLGFDNVMIQKHNTYVSAVLSC